MVLISPETLLTNLDDPAWIVIDCRFDLTNPEWGFQSYQEKHIPGALYAHLDRDLSGPVTAQSGRHPLPDIETFSNRLGLWGVSNESTVVVYDTTGGAYASRLWWMLRFLGHTKTMLLNGGMSQWEKLGFPVTSEIFSHPQAKFQPMVNSSMAVTAEDVDRIRQDPAHLLIDARAGERYRGEKEPIDRVAGHIPGAVNRFHANNLQPDGMFKPAGDLRNEFLAIAGSIPVENIVVYCGSGVTSCHHIIAMESAGLSGVKLYPGSWSEWIRDPNRPIA